MSINRVDSRPPFFPNKSSLQKSRGVKGTQGTQETRNVQETRNTPDRKKELEALSQGNAKVSIKNQVKDFALIKKAVDQAPDIDQSQKIQDLKRRIAQGTYKVSSEALADKIMSSEFSPEI